MSDEIHREAYEPANDDCAECEDYDFVCDGCGCGFCLDHASSHTAEECDRFADETGR